MDLTTIESIDGVSPPNRRRPSVMSRLPYRLAHLTQGAFAFKSCEHMKQPEYPLAFIEKNLKFMLEYRDMMHKDSKMSKQGSMLRLAMRAKIVMMALEMRQTS